MSGQATDEHGLRLIVAFYCIMEPDKRAEVIALAKTLAAASKVVEGHAHFLTQGHGEKPQ